MSRKVLLVETIILALLITGFLFSYQSSPPDLSKGLASADWVQLTSNLGVQLTRDRKFLGSPGDLHGTLYVKIETAWHRLDLDPSPILMVPTR